MGSAGVTRQVNNNTASASATIPATATRGAHRRARASICERIWALRGDVVLASQAGAAAATALASRPRAAPFASVSPGIARLLTEVTKYKSLTVCVTNPTSPRPRMMPPANPRTVPSAPTARASVKTNPNSCRPVTPRVREIPRTSRRLSTEKVMVLKMRNIPHSNASRLIAARFRRNARVISIVASARACASTSRTDDGNDALKSRSPWARGGR